MADIARLIVEQCLQKHKPAMSVELKTAFCLIQGSPPGLSWMRLMTPPNRLRQ